MLIGQKSLVMTIFMSNMMVTKNPSIFTATSLSVVRHNAFKHFYLTISFSAQITSDNQPDVFGQVMLMITMKLLHTHARTITFCLE